jgi:hypothetical protein
MDVTVTGVKSNFKQFSKDDYLPIPALMQANKVSISCLLKGGTDSC